MQIKQGKIIDSKGRILMLRGCNLGGDSKFPFTPDSPSWKPDSLQNPEQVSFVGRPFPIDEADSHFARLASWGFLFIRLILTWEAVEHTGPGIYDESYLAYLRKILKKAEEYGISVFIDPHQDAWSRWTGGDGAPAWTLEKVGFDLSRLSASGSALTQQEMGSAYPQMIWPTNYNRYAAATMFTLFFAGNTFAPDFRIEGDSAQDWLQERYLAAMRHTYRRLKDCKSIVGWGTMNEPHPGFTGYQDLAKLENCHLETGPIPTGFQAMAAASGHPVAISIYHTGALGTQVTGTEVLNPGKVRLFRDGLDCPWKQAGVWDDSSGAPVLLRPDHFATTNGTPVHFADDFLKPFMLKFAERMRDKNKDLLIFIERVPNSAHPHWTSADGDGFINAFHWYDGATLMTKRFRPWISVRTDNRKLVLGKKAVARSFVEQIAIDCEWTEKEMNGIPCLLGEFGVPFDLNAGKALRTGNYASSEEALSRYYDAVDANFLHSTIWNYSATNTHAHGDGWNGENLSIYSQDGGERCLIGWRRPYPIATAGQPVKLRWDAGTTLFEYQFDADPSVEGPTELFAPGSCFRGEPKVTVQDQTGTQPASITIEVIKENSRVLISAPGIRGLLTVRITGV